MLVLVLLLGFGARVMLAEFHSLEGDDAFSLALSHTPTAALVDGLMSLSLDVHPPLHFLALKAWTALTGETLLGLRVMNVLLDVLTAALMLRVLRRTGADGAGLMAFALLWAVSPLLMFGGWLLRMYALLGVLNAAALACAVEAWRDKRWGWTVGAFVFALAALYTHIIGVITLGAVTVVLLVAARDWRGRAAVILGAGAVTLAYAPFAWRVFALMQSGVTLGASVNPANALPAYRVPFALGTTALTHRLAVPDLLALVMLWPLLDRRAWRTRWPLAMAAGLTYVGMVVLGVGAGLYKARYVVPFAPLWMAWLVSGRGWGRGVVVAMLIGAGGLAHTVNITHGWRDDWTAATSWIDGHAMPQDVVVVVPDWGQEAARYHLTAGLPVRGFFPQIAPSLDLEGAFTDFIGEARRVWLVRYQPPVSDPDGLAAAWFDGRYTHVSTAYPAGMDVSLYVAAPIVLTLPEGVRALDVTFGDVLALRGATVPRVTIDADDSRRFDGAGRVWVLLHWQRVGETDGAMPRVRLTDTYGQLYAGALDPSGRGLPLPNVSAWPSDALISVPYDLNVNPTTPNGVYNIEVMVLDANGGPLPATGADSGEHWAIAGQVAVR